MRVSDKVLRVRSPLPPLIGGRDLNPASLTLTDRLTLPESRAVVRRAVDDDTCANCGAWNPTVSLVVTRGGFRVLLCSSCEFKAFELGYLGKTAPARPLAPIDISEAGE